MQTKRTFLRQALLDASGKCEINEDQKEKKKEKSSNKTSVSRSASLRRKVRRDKLL